MVSDVSPLISEQNGASKCPAKPSSFFLSDDSEKPSEDQPRNDLKSLISLSNTVHVSKECLSKTKKPPDEISCCAENGFFRSRIRYAILVVTVLCLTSARSNELSFNFTVICMTSNSTENPVNFF